MHTFARSKTTPGLTLKRKLVLNIQETYYVSSKSFAGTVLFNSPEDIERFKKTLAFYKQARPESSFSYHLRQNGHAKPLETLPNDLVDIQSIKIDSGEVHIILKQIAEKGITTFMGRVLNSYAKYYNAKYQHAGPVWRDRFKAFQIANGKWEAAS
jgi:putative transposase